MFPVKDKNVSCKLPICLEALYKINQKKGFVWSASLYLDWIRECADQIKSILWFSLRNEESLW